MNDVLNYDLNHYYRIVEDVVRDFVVIGNYYFDVYLISNISTNIQISTKDVFLDILEISVVEMEEEVIVS